MMIRGGLLRQLAAFIVTLALATPMMAMKGVVFTSSGLAGK